MCYQKRDRQLTKEKLTETKCVIRRETDNWQKKSLQKLNVLSVERQTIGKRKKGRKVQTMIHKTLCRKLNIILKINHKNDDTKGVIRRLKSMKNRHQKTQIYEGQTTQ